MLLILFFCSTAQAQEFWPGMEPYLQMTLGPEILQGEPVIHVNNLYRSPLVAVVYAYKCTETEHGFHGTDDAAVNYSNPSRQGQTINIQSVWPGCTGRIMAAIWADGKELGDPAALRQFHDCRAVEQEEVHLALEEEIMKVPISQWDPAQSITKLNTRRDSFPMHTTDVNASEIQGCRTTEIYALTIDLEDFQKTASQDPDKYALQRGRFLRFLKEMEQSLGSPTYPAAPFWWKGF